MKENVIFCTVLLQIINDKLNKIFVYKENQIYIYLFKIYISKFNK